LRPHKVNGSSTVYDTARYLPKIADFNLPYLATPLGMTPFEFHQDIQHLKTRFPGLFASSYVYPFRFNTGLW